VPDHDALVDLALIIGRLSFFRSDESDAAAKTDDPFLPGFVPQHADFQADRPLYSHLVNELELDGENILIGLTGEYIIKEVLFLIARKQVREREFEELLLGIVEHGLQGSVG